MRIPSFFLHLLTLCLLTMTSMAETPTEREVTAIIEEYNTAVRTMIISLSSAKSDAERLALRSNGPKPEPYATRLLALASTTQDEPGAVKALCWLSTQAASTPEAATALDLIRTRFAGSAGVWEAAQDLHRTARVTAEPVLRAIISTNKHPEDRCAALHCLGTLLFNAASNVNTPEAKAELEEARQLFHEVLTSYPDVTIRGFKPADQSAAVLFEMENLAIGKVVPEIEGKDTQGAALKLSDYRGKVVLLIFWGGWCHSCHHFLPILRDLQTRLGPEGFSVVGVNSDQPSDLAAQLAKEPMPWPNFADGSSTGPISVVWNIRSWPTLYLIGADGVIQAKQPSLSTLETSIRQLLKK